MAAVVAVVAVATAGTHTLTWDTAVPLAAAKLDIMLHFTVSKAKLLHCIPRLMLAAASQVSP